MVLALRSKENDTVPVRINWLCKDYLESDAPSMLNDPFHAHQILLVASEDILASLLLVVVRELTDFLSMLDISWIQAV